MSEASLRTNSFLDEQPLLGVRNLHNFIYCPRLFYYQWVENIFQENADVVAGKSAHRRVDEPSRLENPEQIGLAPDTKIRSLRLESKSLGIIGVVDLVESTGEGAFIVDYKKGCSRKLLSGKYAAKEPDAMQVVAQWLLLRKNGMEISKGFVYYAEEKRRVEIQLTPETADLCIRKIREAKDTALSGKCPPPLKDDQRCLYCSAYPVCLPSESLHWSSSEKNPVEIKAPPKPENDEGDVIVVQTAGSQVGLRGGQFVVSVKDETLTKVPAEQVRAIYLFGSVQITSQATNACLEKGITVSYFSPAGIFHGLLCPLPASGIDARRGQYRLFENPNVCLSLSKAVIRAKIHNQRVMLMRNSQAQERDLDLMSALKEKLDSCGKLEEVLGCEGEAAAIYFRNFSTMIKNQNASAFSFEHRNRRPPRDPINAVLSLGYSVLCKELAGVCFSVGLDPFLGFMHRPRYGRPALALDLMEEFRPLIVESVVISLINRQELNESDFINASTGTSLNENGRRVFWEAYFRRMDTEVTHPVFGYKMSYRRMFEVQSRQLWRYLRGEADSYAGFITR